MTDSNYINVFTGNFIIVQRIVIELEKIDINAVVKDQTESGLISLFGAKSPSLQQIFVHKDELDRAVQIIENTNTELEA